MSHTRGDAALSGGQPRYYLRDREQQVQENIGETLDWDCLDSQEGTRTSLYFPSNMRIGEEERWPEVQQWFVEALGKVRETFDPHLLECKAMLDEGEFD